MSQMNAGPGTAGKTCPYCQTPIKPGALAYVCDSCGIPHHIECWQQNGGCTTFGCRSVGTPNTLNRGMQQPPSPPNYVQPPAYQNQQYYQQPYETYVPRKSKVTAGVLALLLGGLGVHKFYLGQIGWGIAYLLLCWTYIPSIVALIEGIVYLCMSDQDFNAKYG